MNIPENSELSATRKIQGYSFDDIVSALEKNDISYSIESEPRIARGFFKASDIRFDSLHDIRQLRRLAKPRFSHIHADYYYAYYELPSTLGWLQVPGRVVLTFHDGKLVEQVRVYYR
ncbi:MAG: hypothetical protein HY514_04780 [Candidatus Aenigmarchaeota archaeon]|nr:hypothetical protein [Candidatus Aenigmarchaeota archaeon]